MSRKDCSQTKKCKVVSNIHTTANLCSVWLYIKEQRWKPDTRVLRQTGVRRREMMRLQDIGDKHSLIRSLEAVNSWVASHQGQNWFSCQRVNYPAAIYSFRASPGRIPSPCHSCLMSNTVYTFHTTCCCWWWWWRWWWLYLALPSSFFPLRTWS